ncbi:hypothetical protein Cadr_000009541 [Camelus dromedarius]|uniref:Uncharacterized protein n=1 Tax=Camelus dromedarius TaxID=9838 RepID=A0A5N4DJE1_CAMDR|nr:hypothetical protein Cadr_000009541 [Camelus dromedarius]
MHSLGYVEVGRGKGRAQRDSNTPKNERGRIPKAGSHLSASRNMSLSLWEWMSWMMAATVFPDQKRPCKHQREAARTRVHCPIHQGGKCFFRGRKSLNQGLRSMSITLGGGGAEWSGRKASSSPSASWERAALVNKHPPPLFSKVLPGTAPVTSHVVFDGGSWSCAGLRNTFKVVEIIRESGLDKRHVSSEVLSTPHALQHPTPARSCTGDIWCSAAGCKPDFPAEDASHPKALPFPEVTTRWLCQDRNNPARKPQPKPFPEPRIDNQLGKQSRFQGKRSELGLREEMKMFKPGRRLLSTGNARGKREGSDHYPCGREEPIPDQGKARELSTGQDAHPKGAPQLLKLDQKQRPGAQQGRDLGLCLLPRMLPHICRDHLCPPPGLWVTTWGQNEKVHLEVIPLRESSSCLPTLGHKKEVPYCIIGGGQPGMAALPPLGPMCEQRELGKAGGSRQDQVQGHVTRSAGILGTPAAKKSPSGPQHFSSRRGPGQGAAEVLQVTQGQRGVELRPAGRGRHSRSSWSLPHAPPSPQMANPLGPSPLGCPLMRGRAGQSGTPEENILWWPMQ